LGLVLHAVREKSYFSFHLTLVLINLSVSMTLHVKNHRINKNDLAIKDFTEE